MFVGLATRAPRSELRPNEPAPPAGPDPGLGADDERRVYYVGLPDRRAVPAPHAGPARRPSSVRLAFLRAVPRRGGRDRRDRPLTARHASDGDRVESRRPLRRHARRGRRRTRRDRAAAAPGPPMTRPSWSSWTRTVAPRRTAWPRARPPPRSVTRRQARSTSAVE